MKKILLILILLILTGGLIFYIGTKSSKKLELVYETNGGVPYEWKYEIEDENIIKFVKKYEVENKNNNMVGAPIKIKYIFKGLKEGTTKLIFKYINITDKAVAKEDTYKIRVDKNKNITIIK